jgi:hypothetical protein
MSRVQRRAHLSPARPRSQLEPHPVTLRRRCVRKRILGTSTRPTKFLVVKSSFGFNSFGALLAEIAQNAAHVCPAEDMLRFLFVLCCFRGDATAVQPMDDEMEVALQKVQEFAAQESPLRDYHRSL